MRYPLLTKMCIISIALAILNCCFYKELDKIGIVEYTYGAQIVLVFLIIGYCLSRPTPVRIVNDYDYYQPPQPPHDPYQHSNVQSKHNRNCNCCSHKFDCCCDGFQQC